MSHSSNALPLVVIALILTALLPSASAGSCPAFVGAKAACGATTCGRYVFKGAFANSRSDVAQFRVRSARDGLRLGRRASPADCCHMCRQQPQCSYWNFLATSGVCYLYTSGVCAANNGISNVYSPREPDSYVGGRCSWHGQQEYRYQAESAPPARPYTQLRPTSFCLVSDSRLHINMRLTGYLDNNRSDIMAALVAGAKVRTWIRELGFVWWSNSGAASSQHSLRLVARRGAKQERGDGFMGRIEVDGITVPRLGVGDELSLFDGEGTVSYTRQERSGNYDVDVYSVRLAGLLEAEVRLRPAHPLLQEEDDAEVHQMLDLGSIRFSPSVDGVLGQAYRDEGSNHDLNYAILANLMTRAQSVAADVSPDEWAASSASDADAAANGFESQRGEGSSFRSTSEQNNDVDSGGIGRTSAYDDGYRELFPLEGRAEDYISSSVVAPDCRVSQYAFLHYAGEPGGVARVGEE
ncbi:hypothetical protein CLOM_g8214 [Closterium sp. NIES-68]|nr:hypothetical protein CLOM_g8214 [Closterium sp. NIES-68]GJP66123.1 hypothetical protein CLOP_g23036 [Closterium sp. NIES-67]